MRVLQRGWDVARSVERATDRAVTTARVLAGAGLITPVRPDRLLGMGLALGRWGMSPATAVAAAAARSPDAVAVVDDAGAITFEELDARSNAVACGLAEFGLGEHDAVALLIRNSRQFVVALAAVSKLGGDLVYLNTGFGADQLAGVIADEQVAAVIADEEFEHLIGEAAPDLPCVLAWVDGVRDDAVTLDRLAAGDDGPPPPPRHVSRHVILTSGTTGRPKGAPRDAPGPLGGVELLVALVEAIPLRARETTVLATPMFHAWGLAQLVIGLLLRSTLVVSRRFDPEHVLRLLDEHEASALVAVPSMLQRIVELPADVRRRHPVPALRVAALSGSAIPAWVAEQFMDEYGDVVHNLYGSTEVAYATVATPEDLREVPGTAGRPLHGVTLRILDEAGRPVPDGTPGRIFAGNALTFAGYTGGRDRERRDGLVATGDVGRLDGSGRLLVEGRDDDMIVSGGENVYPREVEDCLLTHPDVADVVVLGVPDERFGQALVAHVVLRRKGDAQRSVDAEGSVDAGQLRRHVRLRLATYKVPREVVFHETLPRNETGKVLRAHLPAGSVPRVERREGPQPGTS